MGDYLTEQEFARLQEERSNGQRPYRSTRLADVEPERVRWLWPGRLPLGKVVTLDGAPGTGKSTLTLDLAARVTTCQAMPGEDLASVPASAVLLMSAEDGMADTIRPRLDAAGADSTLVHHFDGVTIFDDDGFAVGERPPVLPDDLAMLEALVGSTGAVLVVVDVLMAFLSGRTDAHRDQDVRAALARLAAVADRTGACVVVLRHLRKSGGDAITSGTGSIGIIGAARAGLVVALDPDDETEQRRVLAVAKSNLAAKPPSLAYHLVGDEERGCARVDWRGESAHTADQLVAPRDTATRSKVERAYEWLGDQLASGPRSWRQLKAEAEAVDLDKNALHRAREKWGDALVIERDDSAQGRPSTWRLLTSHGQMRRNHETKPDSAVTRGNTPDGGVTSQLLDPETKQPEEAIEAGPGVLGICTFCGSERPILEGRCRPCRTGAEQAREVLR